MNTEHFVFDSPPLADTHLKITANRYTFANSSQNTQGLTLICAHCVGSHKEQWEPVISQLFEQQAKKAGLFFIREIWAFDWQNHGDAAVINEHVLRGLDSGVSAFVWSRAIAEFVQSSRMKGHHIVSLGHSAGAAAMILTTRYFSIDYLPYLAIILVEPTMVTREVFNSQLEERMSAMQFVVAATAARRDKWRSREEARAYFGKRVPWDMWDARSLNALIEHGLEPTVDGVRLKCDRKQESVSYSDVEPHFEGALQLGRISRLLPVHLIWGTRNDLVPDFIKESLADISHGRKVASVTKVEHAGHMIVQEQPDLLAQAISKILGGIMVLPTPRL